MNVANHQTTLHHTMPATPSLPVLDACCGARMFWFNKQDPRAIFMDNRTETHILTDTTRKQDSRVLHVAPDIQADFTCMPFADESYSLVIFDPPHLIRAGKNGWLAKKYGKLGANWKDDLTKGFAECFRVLQANGTLIFKWNEDQIPVSQILELTPHKPLFGNRCGKSSKSHWIVFIKPSITTITP